jgi:hypothetical protein
MIFALNSLLKSNLTFVEYKLNLPRDFRIKKYTIYMQGRDRTPLFDIFNSTNFEMIPFWEINNYKIGNPFVLLRFQFINLWSLRIILNIGSESKFIENKIRVILNRSNKLRRLIDEIISGSNTNYAVTDLFQLDNYIGKYINEFIAKKQLIKKIGMRFPIYYPALKDKNEEEK